MKAVKLVEGQVAGDDVKKDWSATPRRKQCLVLRCHSEQIGETLKCTTDDHMVS